MEKIQENFSSLISIIVPVYNVEKYLSRCLDSVLAQTFKDFELIAVNDGSADNSTKILADYAARDPRIKIITQQNQGQSVARNNGLKAALPLL
ncbi:MAG: glycosyltransferase, partial [Elusimicrobiota bacterium]|nr:glycosyltransferase [Elusimicrobiota bacterium]